MDSHSSDSNRRPAFTFRDLLVWKLSRSLTSDIYRLCDTEKLRTRYSYCDQIGRAALSVPSNICEGDERGTNKEALRFLMIARGSLAELETQLWVGHDMGWMTTETYQQLEQKRTEVARLLGGLIRSRKNRL